MKAEAVSPSPTVQQTPLSAQQGRIFTPDQTIQSPVVVDSPTTTTSFAVSVEDKKLQLEQMKQYLDAYKHHFDLYLKGHALFYAIAGALAGYVFKEGASSLERVLVGSLLAIGGAVAAIGSRVCWAWVRDIEQQMRAIEETLGAARFPFSGARGVVAVIGTCSLALSATVVGWLIAAAT